MQSAAELLKQGFLRFDGAMGTLWAARSGKSEEACEHACRIDPDGVAAIHREYIAAGAQAIKTNTFTLSAAAANGEDPADAIECACRVAITAAGEDAIVFADLGPVPEGAQFRAGDIFIRQAECFAQYGIRHFLCETLADDDGIAPFAAWLAEHVPDAFLLVSFAASGEGYTRSARSVRELIERVTALDGVSAAGLNCMCGPSHMLRITRRLDTHGKPLSVMPNAGYPTVIGRHTVFSGQPDYFGGRMAELARSGAVILGGCCGTTPAHIACMTAAIRDVLPAARREEALQFHLQPDDDNRLWQKLARGERVVAVEMDPPRDDDITSFEQDALRVVAAGADVITLADCPVGRPRADSCMLASRLHRTHGIEALPHMTCRDRNLNATQALLLGLSMEGVRNILIVTGDPVPSEDRDAVRSVFNFNSRKLAAFISGLNGQTLHHPFRVFGALNVNARNFDVQLRLAKEKEQNGVSGFLTQPVLSPEAVENLKRARSELRGKLLGGIYPPVSHRNALFLNNEISGIRVSQEIIDRYEGLDREQGEEEGIRVAAETARQILPYTDGIYLVMPFRRTDMVCRILNEIRMIEAEEQNA